MSTRWHARIGRAIKSMELNLPDRLEEMEEVGDVKEVGCEDRESVGPIKSDESTSFTDVPARVNAIEA